MTLAYAGFSLFHLRRAAVETAVRRAALDLLCSPHWGGELRYFASVATAGHRLWRRPGMVPAKSLRQTADEALQADGVASFTMATAGQNGPGYRSVTFTRDAQRSPFSISYGERPAADVQIDAWVDDVVAFFDRMDGRSGVVAVMASNDEIASECGEGGVSRNDRLVHPFPEQHARTRGANRRQIGARFMRFPRWGTLVSHDHVGQLGGVEAIARAVEPAVVRPLAGGVYFQLTATVAAAMSDEAAAKQAAFTTFAAPLLPPPVTPLGGET